MPTLKPDKTSWAITPLLPCYGTLTGSTNIFRVFFSIKCGNSLSPMPRAARESCGSELRNDRSRLHRRRLPTAGSPIATSRVTNARCRRRRLSAGSNLPLHHPLAVRQRRDAKPLAEGHGKLCCPGISAGERHLLDRHVGLRHEFLAAIEANPPNLLGRQPA